MTHDVPVSGGGPVWLGFAIELGQCGQRIAVVERGPDLGRILKYHNLTQRRMETLCARGVEAAIRDAKTVPKGIGLAGVTARGSPTRVRHYDWYNRADVRADHAAASERLRQSETERVPRDRVATLTVARGGETRRLEAPYLVGCGRSRSLVRRAIGIRETVRDQDRLMALVVFRSPELFALVSDRFPDKQFFNVLHPDLDGDWMVFGAVDWGERFFFHAPVPEDTDRASFDPTDLVRRAVGEPVAVEALHVGFWALRIALADSYRAGPVFIAGNAVHSHPPHGGYGENNGLEDAGNLGGKLVAVLEGWGGPGLLDSYDAERRPVFRSTAEDFIERFISDDRTFLQAHSPEYDRAGFERDWAQRPARTASNGIGGYVPHFDGSPIVRSTPGARTGAIGEPAFTARPGYHLPPMHAAGPRPARVAPGPGFLLRCETCNVSGFAAAAARLGLPFRVERDLGPGRSGVGAPVDLVHPDGFAARAGDPRAGRGAFGGYRTSARPVMKQLRPRSGSDTAGRVLRGALKD